MTVQTFLKAAQGSGLAHNSGAGGEFILVGTGAQLEALERALQGDGGYVPGVMRCDRCNFELTRVSLNVNVGTATAGNSEPEPCPNGCGPLRPTTWKERATEGEKALETWCDRAIAAEKALAANGVRVPDDSATVQQINPPDAGPMPSICEGMEKPDLWAYAHLCGWRAAGVDLPDGAQQ